MELYELKNICMEMSELGAAQTVKSLFSENDGISQRKAYDFFGKARVKNWIKRDLLKRKISGSSKNSKILYSFSELKSIAVAEKLKKIIENN